MNNSIDFNRIGLLLKRFFIENKSRELMFWSIVIIVFALYFQLGLSVSLIYIAGLIFAARQFKFFSFKPSGMHYIMIPATQVEKTLSAIILSTFYFFGMMMVSFVLAKIIDNIVLNLIFEANSPILLSLTQNSTLYTQIENGMYEFLDIFMTFATIQAIFMLGSLYFAQNAIVKTMLSLIVIFIAVGIVEMILFKTIVGQEIMSSGMMNLQISMNSDGEFLSNSETFSTISRIILVGFLWVVSYFRLCEKQI